MDEDSGKRFLPRIWEKLEPEAGVLDVETARRNALERLASFPAKLKGGIKKKEMAKRIEQDCDLLQELVIKRGSFGACALPDALEPIVYMRILNDDGNFRDMIFATESYCFCIMFATS